MLLETDLHLFVFGQISAIVARQDLSIADLFKRWEESALEAKNGDDRLCVLH
jgi:hypothetical protein